MSSDASFAEFVVGQMAGAGEVFCRKMFGEYAVYAGGKVVGLICNNQLFIKPTEPGRAFIGQPSEAQPYPGAKPWWRIDEGLEDRDGLSELVKITATALPPPKPKSKSKTRAIKS